MYIDYVSLQLCKFKTNSNNLVNESWEILITEKLKKSKDFRIN